MWDQIERNKRGSVMVVTTLGVLLVAIGAAMWGTDAVLRVPLLKVASPSQIVLLEHLVLLLYSVPAVVLGERLVLFLLAKEQVLWSPISTSKAARKQLS